MGLVEDINSRDGLVAALLDVTEKQFMIARNLTAAVLEAFGEEGMAVVERGFREYGKWRGENLLMSPSSISGNRNARWVLQNWDCGDLIFATKDSSNEIDGGPLHATLTLPSMLGSWQFKTAKEMDLLKRYWTHTLDGIASGFNPGCSILSTVHDNGAWTIAVKFDPLAAKGAALMDIGVDPAILSDASRALPLIRSTSRNAGALYMFVAREVIREYDASGEQAIREGVRGFGRERGNALRDKHLSEGKELNMKTLMLDWDGPLVSTWVFKEEGFLSEGTWHQECLFCPYADVWNQFGSEGLALGHLYDVELHTTLYQTYYPGTLVRWEALKTRGDHVCKFHISIPEFVGPNDPKFQRPAS